jgi:uncharacterized protein
MILARDRHRGDYEICAYEPGRFIINKEAYTQSVLVSAHRLALWQPQNLKALTSHHLKIILDFKADVVLLGMGEHLFFPPNDLFCVFYENRIGVEVMTTIAACRTFNVLMSEDRNVVAALLIR